MFNVVSHHPDNQVPLHDHLPSLACSEKVQHYFLVCAHECPTSGCRICEEDGGADLPDRLILVGETPGDRVISKLLRDHSIHYKNVAQNCVLSYNDFSPVVSRIS